MSSKIFFTPGPSQLYHTIPQHLKNALRENIGSISHRSSAFQKLFAEMKERLKDLLSIPDEYDIFLMSSATEVWERIVQNLITKSSHHFVNGSFSKRFYDFTKLYQLQSTATIGTHSKEFESFDLPENSELISITLNETSTGYAFDQKRLKALSNKYPDKLIALDVVSAVPAVSVDFSMIDTAYFSVQKCFGLPSGLGIWITNEQCLDRAKQKVVNNKVIGSYHSLPSLKKNSDKNQTPETPNILSIYLLLQVIKDMQTRGIEMIRNETKATLLYQAFENLSYLRPFMMSKTNKSLTVCVAEVDQDNHDLLNFLAAKGLVIGEGYGEYESQHIRVANFPAHSREQVEMLVDYLHKY
jgi:phosphoserine aminotransferase